MDYLELSLNQFLDVITDKVCEYKVQIIGNDEINTISATKKEFEQMILEQIDILKKDEYIKLNELEKSMKYYEYDIELTQSEIFNYLEKVTGNFNLEKIKNILFDIDVYYNMEFLERIDNESINIYNKKKWDIPIRELTIFNETKYIPDYIEMRNKTHFCIGMRIEYAMNLLKRKLNEYEQTIPPTSIKDVKNKYPQYFSDYGYSLFVYLNEQYESKELRTKYSNIYHFFKYCEIMECTQLEYIEFVKTEYQITLSKIIVKTSKYTDTIQPKLLRFKSEFDKIN